MFLLKLSFYSVKKEHNVRLFVSALPKFQSVLAEKREGPRPGVKKVVLVMLTCRRAWASHLFTA